MTLSIFLVFTWSSKFLSGRSAGNSNVYSIIRSSTLGIFKVSFGIIIPKGSTKKIYTHCLKEIIRLHCFSGRVTIVWHCTNSYPLTFISNWVCKKYSIFKAKSPYKPAAVATQSLRCFCCQPSAATLCDFLRGSAPSQSAHVPQCHTGTKSWPGCIPCPQCPALWDTAAEQLRCWAQTQNQANTRSCSLHEHEIMSSLGLRVRHADSHDVPDCHLPTCRPPPLTLVKPNTMSSQAEHLINLSGTQGSGWKLHNPC